MSLLEEFLKIAREESNMTQLELSKKLKLTSPQFVSNWERGIAKVPVKTLARLVAILQLDVETVVDLRILDNKENLKRALRVRR